MLLVGEAAGVGEEPEPRDLERERRRVVLGRRLRQGVASVIPSPVRARSSSACSTRSITAGGTIVVVVAVAGSVELIGTLDAVAIASASAASASITSCSASARAAFAAHGPRPHRHRLAWLDQIGTDGLHVADGGGVVGEQLAVAVERFEVPLGDAAQLLACLGE